jgi:hypothetical protein
VKISAMGFLPMATRLMWPLSTGIENDADFTSDVSLASASILKSGYRRHFWPDIGRVDRPELHRAVMRVADYATGAGDDPRAEQIELRRVEEIDVALLVVPLRQLEARERLPDLVVRNRRLDLDGVGAGDLPCDLAACCHSAFHHRPPWSRGRAAHLRRDEIRV